MSLPRVDVYIAIHGDPSAGIMPLQDHIELQWDLDEMTGERERVRTILREACCYAWDDDRYREETRLAFEAVLKLIAEVQHPAQLRFHQVIGVTRSPTGQ